MKYVFNIKNMVVVEAETLEEAWDLLPEIAQNNACDFDYELNEEETEFTNNEDN